MLPKPPGHLMVSILDQGPNLSHSYGVILSKEKWLRGQKEHQETPPRGFFAQPGFSIWGPGRELWMATVKQ